MQPWRVLDPSGALYRRRRMAERRAAGVSLSRPPPEVSLCQHSMAGWRGGPNIALDVWVTQEQEGLKGEHLLRKLLLLHNPDTQSSVWATPAISMTQSVPPVPSASEALNHSFFEFTVFLSVPPRHCFQDSFNIMQITHITNPATENGISMNKSGRMFPSTASEYDLARNNHSESPIIFTRTLPPGEPAAIAEAMTPQNKSCCNTVITVAKDRQCELQHEDGQTMHILKYCISQPPQKRVVATRLLE